MLEHTPPTALSARGHTKRAAGRRYNGARFRSTRACAAAIRQRRPRPSPSSMQKIILPFVSGFLASLFFHESTLALLHAAGLIDPTGFSTAPFMPIGLPEFIANAIWSSVWAVLMAWLLRVAPERPA